MSELLVALFLSSLLVQCLSQDDVATIELSVQNHDEVLNSSQVVFVAFCADWCPFSRRLKPIFEESARVFKRENPQASVVWAIVDSVRQAEIGDKYFVNKYPTMKIFVNGELIQKEYRSTRSVEALTSFVKYQLSTAINEFTNEEQLNEAIDRSKRNIVAWVRRGDEVYTNIKKIASLLREECNFWVSAEATSSALSQDRLYYIDPDNQQEQHFSGDFRDYNFLKQWVTDKCIPLVREVTFENVEELTEEGLPFLLYFRDPKKKDEDKIFTEQVIRELYDQRAAVNPLLADGLKFAHPLKHLGKTKEDLPVLAIDSFQHMYLFPDMSQLTVPGKLREFVMDLHSGKLHKDFHETLDQKLIDLAKFKEKHGITDEDLEDNRENDGQMPSARPEDTTPPPSVFKQLKPSEKRYSLLQKTEL
ncbi:thioredoxin [Dictyocaulus viviparus]|uniref:Thioredoxin n=1 Tax=Dictyocaulus viviparus TaxID=29172 RepID=A0A0D8XFK9_DICVI|nr:thioredoxin [Dictyocaulus viviparus]